MFEHVDLSDFWSDDKLAEEYLSEPVTDEMIQELEEYLGYKLPASYIFLMKRHNGGEPKRQYCADICGTGIYEIEGIYGIGKTKASSLGGWFGTKHWVDEWGYPDIGIAICDCPSAGHDMIFLDYRACGKDGEPQVVHIDQEGDYEITVLASNFEEFISKLSYEEEIDLERIREKQNVLKQTYEKARCIDVDDNLHKIIVKEYLKCEYVIPISLLIFLFICIDVWQVIHNSNAAVQVICALTGIFLMIFMGYRITDLSKLGKRTYKCSIQEVEKIWNTSGSIKCKVVGIKAECEVFHRDYQDIKAGDPVIMVQIEQTNYVLIGYVPGKKDK